MGTGAAHCSVPFQPKALWGACCMYARLLLAAARLREGRLPASRSQLLPLGHGRHVGSAPRAKALCLLTEAQRRGCCHHSHFTGEKTEAQSGRVTQPRVTQVGSRRAWLLQGAFLSFLPPPSTSLIRPFPAWGWGWVLGRTLSPQEAALACGGRTRRWRGKILASAGAVGGTAACDSSIWTQEPPDDL